MRTKSPAPGVSIIIPFYKMGRYLSEALDSVNAQTFHNWEIIIADDCSPEPASAVIGFHQGARGPEKLRILRHDANRGVSAARNTAMAAARAEWFAFLDPDDAWSPDYLSTMLDNLKTSGKDAVTCRLQVLDGRPEAARTMLGPSDIQIRDFPKSLFGGCFIYPSATIIRRTIVDSIGGFDESPRMQHIEDWDYWLRMVEATYSFTFVVQPLVLYRKHADAASARLRPQALRSLACIEKHLPLAPQFRAELRALEVFYARYFSCALAKSHPMLALTLAFRAVLRAPLDAANWRNLGGRTIEAIRRFGRTSKSEPT